MAFCITMASLKVKSFQILMMVSLLGFPSRTLSILSIENCMQWVLQVLTILWPRSWIRVGLGASRPIRCLQFELMRFCVHEALSNIKKTLKAIPYWQGTPWLQGLSISGTNPEKCFSLSKPSSFTTKRLTADVNFSLPGFRLSRFIGKGSPNHKPDCICTKQES